MTSDSQAVLELFGASPPAIVHTTDELPQGLNPTAMQKGFCHLLPLGQATVSVAGVKFQNLLLPGEVVR